MGWWRMVRHATLSQQSSVTFFHSQINSPKPHFHSEQNLQLQKLFWLFNKALLICSTLNLYFYTLLDEDVFITEDQNLVV